MRGHTLMKLNAVTYFQVCTHVTADIFKVTGSKVKVTDNIFCKRSVLVEEYRLTLASESRVFS